MDKFRRQAKEIADKLTLSEKLFMLTSNFPACGRLSIGEFNIGTEVARGYVSHGEGGKPTDISTVFPQPIGLASTFDRELLTELGKIAAEELRYYWQGSAERKTRLMLFGPTVDLLRDPRWGRNEEAYGEDPYLSGEQALSYCKGLVGDGEYMKTAPGLKHFCANNNEETRASDNADITMKLLHEYYYAPFRKIIKAGKAAGLMAAYNELGGVPAVMNPHLKAIVKGEWGADYVVSDGGDFSQNYLNHKQFSSHAEAFAYTVKNGTDACLDNADMVANAAREALRQGLITEADIDLAVENTLTVRAKLGEFDPDCEYNKAEFKVDTKEFQATNKRAAYEQVCLLANDGMLPLSKDKKIALIGPIADENYNDWYTGTASYYVSIKDGMEKVFGEVAFDNGYDHVKIKSGETLIDGIYEHHDWGEDKIHAVMTFKDIDSGLYLSEDEDGVYNPTAVKVYDWFTKQWFKPSYDKNTDSFTFKNVFDKPIGITDGKITAGISRDRFTLQTVSTGAKRASDIASKADVAVVVVGNQPMLLARECYDRKTLRLPEKQKKLILETVKANPNTILVICSSYPYILEGIEKLVRGIIYTTHAGAELGNAVADVIAGNYNPAARCPQTWYRYDDDLPGVKDYRIDKNETTYRYFKGDPLFAFGHGLSYSNFTYENFVADGTTFKIDIKNISDRSGDEVVQLYAIGDCKRLCGYERVNIKAGETKTVTIKVDPSDLYEYNPETEKLALTPGLYTFAIGKSSKDLCCQKQIELTGEAVSRDLTRRTLAKNYDESKNTKLAFDYKKNDWYVSVEGGQGCIDFANTDLVGITAVEITASAPNAAVSASVQLKLEDKYENCGECEVKPSVSHTDFAVYNIPVAVPENADLTSLRINLGGMMNIYSIQVITKL
ncbi:MAG: glycoside hydrolase family 3 C-terminal domain-containing protein [Ruminococcus sp.]|jgi:beta-glucosidase|nr:glycoside hydrolase family 3 C-terminal domain-containing protein [Ruminococcus sp.]